MKTSVKFFVTAFFAVAMLCLVGCGNSKYQKAAENFGLGKTFFESYNIKTDGTYIAGRIVSAEDRKYENGWGVFLTLDNGKTFMMAHDEVYKSYPIVFLTEEDKPLHRDEPNTYDAETVKDLYVEAIVNDGISYLFVYYNYADHQRAQAFMKKGTKPETKESSLDIKDYRDSKYMGNPKSSGKSSVKEVVNYYGLDDFTSYYMSDGTVLTLSQASLNDFLDHDKKRIEKGMAISYILSDMKSEGVEDGTDIFTNILDYKVE